MSFVKIAAVAMLISCFGLAPALAQTSSATGGGAQGSMSSVNGTSDGGGMSKGSMGGMSGSHMMKKKHHKMKHSMKSSGGM